MSITLFRVLGSASSLTLSLMLLAVPDAARADGTVECNSNATGGTNSTACGVNSTASGGSSTGVGARS